jgi:hypothetical protein
MTTAVSRDDADAIIASLTSPLPELELARKLLRVAEVDVDAGARVSAPTLPAPVPMAEAVPAQPSIPEPPPAPAPPPAASPRKARAVQPTSPLVRPVLGNLPADVIDRETALRKDEVLRRLRAGELPAVNDPKKATVNSVIERLHTGFTSRHHGPGWLHVYLEEAVTGIDRMEADLAIVILAALEPVTAQQVDPRAGKPPRAADLTELALDCVDRVRFATDEQVHLIQTLASRVISRVSARDEHGHIVDSDALSHVRRRTERIERPDIHSIAREKAWSIGCVVRQTAETSCGTLMSSKSTARGDHSAFEHFAHVVKRNGAPMNLAAGLQAMALVSRISVEAAITILENIALDLEKKPATRSRSWDPKYAKDPPHVRWTIPAGKIPESVLLTFDVLKLVDEPSEKDRELLIRLAWHILVETPEGDGAPAGMKFLDTLQAAGYDLERRAKVREQGGFTAAWDRVRGLAAQVL